MKTYSFTEEDINLITFALRQLSKNTGFENIKNDAENLLNYTERLKSEHYPTMKPLYTKQAMSINTYLKSNS